MKQEIKEVQSSEEEDNFSSREEDEEEYKGVYRASQPGNKDETLIEAEKTGNTSYLQASHAPSRVLDDSSIHQTTQIALEGNKRPIYKEKSLLEGNNDSVSKNHSGSFGGGKNPWAEQPDYLVPQTEVRENEDDMLFGGPGGDRFSDSSYEDV